MSNSEDNLGEVEILPVDKAVAIGTHPGGIKYCQTLATDHRDYRSRPPAINSKVEESEKKEWPKNSGSDGVETLEEQ